MGLVITAERKTAKEKAVKPIRPRTARSLLPRLRRKDNFTLFHLRFSFPDPRGYMHLTLT